MAGGIELQFDALSYTLMALVIATAVIPVVLSKDPDIHPFALLRQSSVAPVRNPKESAVYRSLQTPQGYPLVTGLQLPSEQKYSSRSGDIRDIWKLAIENGKGKVFSIKGADVEEHDINNLTKQIHALGSHLQELGVKRIAVYLPNDTENLVASFACAFYGIVLIVLPFEPKTPVLEIGGLLKRSSADALIAPGGQLPLEELKGVSLKEIVLVVEKASQHLGWSEPIGSITCVQYADVVRNETEPIQDIDIDLDAPAVVIFGPKTREGIDMVEFSHRNIIAGVASQTVALPKAEKYSSEDVFLPVDTLSDLYTRIHTFVALSSGSTVALNPIGGKHADIGKCCKAAKPTVIVASPESLFEMYQTTRGAMIEMWHGLVHFFQTRTLTVGGRIPQGNFLTKFKDYTRPEVGPNLRLVFVAETGGDEDSQALNSLDLSDLRVFFKCKVVYGLKHHKVAGPVTQCNVYDYRVQKPLKLSSQKKGIPRSCAHFGGVTPGLEIKLRDIGGFTVEDPEGPMGEISVCGAPVSGCKETNLKVVGKWDSEGVLSYV